MDRTVFKGVVHGSIIKLDTEPGLADGQSVTVTLKTVDEKKSPGDGLRAAFAAWSDDQEGLEQYLEWSRQQRHNDSREVEP